MKTNEEVSPQNNSDKSKEIKKTVPRRSGGDGTVTAIIISIVLFVGLAVSFIVSQNNNRNEINALISDKDMMTALVHSQDSILNDYVLTIDEIDSNIEILTNRHRILVNESAGSEISVDRRKKILEDIQYINYMLAENKKQIANLSDKLSNSRLKISGYEKKLIALNKTISQMDTSITQLKQQLSGKDFEIVDLNLKVGTMDGKLKVQTSEINTMQTQLAGLDASLNTGYLISGTYKELKEKGVIAKSGGFLGVGGNVKMANTIDDGSFEPIDIRKTRTIALSAKRAQLISVHPKESYHWVTKENKIESLEITDPNNFWKYTKYAVLETR